MTLKMDHTGGRPEDLNCSYPMDTTLGVNYSKPSVDSDIGHKILLVNTERLSESFLVWKNLIKEDFSVVTRQWGEVPSGFCDVGRC